MRIVHVITGLSVGGAETMLQKLLGVMDRDRFDPVVVSLGPEGEIGPLIRAEGIPVINLGIKGASTLPRGLWRLRALAAQFRPEVIQGWMYHGNLAASLLAFFSAGEPKLFWNIRHSVDDLQDEKFTTRTVIKLGSRFAGGPRGIIVNSTISVQQHVALGYPAAKCLMIPNGFDTALFRPDPRARVSLIDELGLDAAVRLVGMAARRHPMKGHEDFLEACPLVAARFPSVHFLMVGRGVTQDDPVLSRMAREPSLAGRVHFLGQRRDLHGLMAGLDLFCMPSRFGEGFPNVLGEAMSCGVPCVATDVGEARSIVEGTGRIVPAAAPTALGAAMLEMLAADQAEAGTLGGRCREKIIQNYSLAGIGRQYEALYSG